LVFYFLPIADTYWFFLCRFLFIILPISNNCNKIYKKTEGNTKVLPSVDLIFVLHDNDIDGLILDGDLFHRNKHIYLIACIAAIGGGQLLAVDINNGVLFIAVV